MKSIPLSNGQFTLVDVIDYEHLMQWKWNVLGNRTKNVGRKTNIKDKQIMIYMRRVIAERIGLEIDGLEVIHMDHNILNNQRSNLRAVTPAERRTHSKLNKNNTTGYRGVCKERTNTFVASIKVNKRRIYLGSFSTAEEAALAYNKAAKKYYGEFAYQNIIGD